MRMKLRNIIRALKDQGPFPRFVKNVRNGSIRGLFHERSHFTKKGEAKVAYNTKKSSLKACEKMGKKYGAVYDSYKCIFCDGYHIGRNPNKNPKK